MSIGAVRFLTDFKIPLYASLKLTGTINGSPSTNIVLPK